ncbi:MAG TPA: hypothetical protein VEP12_07300 [Candidatus Acidoferrum sp.]|nr:hypothetical protein [Candidatus Acidoferrum sp.]
MPYLLFDGSLSAIPGVYARLGELLGVGARGRALARYAERLLTETDRRVARAPAAQRPRAYYARGPKGLETAARGSINVELGAPDEVITRESLRAVYGVEVTVLEVARADGRVTRVCVPAVGASGHDILPGHRVDPP